MELERPDTAAEILDTVALWMDLADRAFAALAAQQGRSHPRGTTVQNDLRMMATWLREHPDTDAQMHAVVAVTPGA